jgi:hypothetical protein
LNPLIGLNLALRKMLVEFDAFDAKQVLGHRNHRTGTRHTLAVIRSSSIPAAWLRIGRAAWANPARSRKEAAMDNARVKHIEKTPAVRGSHVWG